MLYLWKNSMRFMEKILNDLEYDAIVWRLVPLKFYWKLMPMWQYWEEGPLGGDGRSRISALLKEDPKGCLHQSAM